MEPNLAVSIYVRSSIKFLHFVPFGLWTWPPRIILFSDWLMLKNLLLWNSLAKWSQTWHIWSLGVSLLKLCPTAPPLHSRWLLFFKVMIISLWNLLQYHSIVRWAIQAQWAEPLVYSYIGLALQKHPPMPQCII